jgi:thiosulfate dehydrogenase (quinone) large subunit
MDSKNLKQKIVWTLLRLSLGWMFLWAVLDKTFGLGYATTSEKSWLNGNSPTYGFLKFGANGVLGDYFKNLAGNQLVDWLFMLGMLFLGVALISGIAIKQASYTGILMMLLMYAALVPSKNNPLIDEHIIYSIVLLGIGSQEEAGYLSLQKWWRQNSFIQKTFLKYFG